jgi:nucleoside 2-deoxyribosyltransferase
LATLAQGSAQDEEPNAKKSKEKTVSIAAPIVFQPAKDWKLEEKNKNLEAKKKAALVLKKTARATKKKTNTTTSKKEIKRKVLTNHNLSESESE